MSFSYSAIWDDAVRLLKSHASLLIAVAGVFLLLPELFVSYFFPRPEATSFQQMLQLASVYVTANWPVLFAAAVASAIGAITMLLLMFERGISVGGAIAATMPLLIGYLVANFFSNLLVVCGLTLFLVPGLYLLGRLAPIGAVVAAEKRRNPIDVIRRSIELTRKRGWAVVGLLLLVFVAGSLVVFATSRVIGAIFLLLAGPRLGGLLALILDSGLSAGLTVITLGVYAAIYRRLVAQPQPTVPRSSGI